MALMTALTAGTIWLMKEVEKVKYGEVSIRFSIHNGQITLIKRESAETEKVKQA